MAILYERSGAPPLAFRLNTVSAMALIAMLSTFSEESSHGGIRHNVSPLHRPGLNWCMVSLWGGLFKKNKGKLLKSTDPIRCC